MRGPAVALVARGDGVFAVEAAGALGSYDEIGKRAGEVALPKGTVQALAFGGAWLCRVPGAPHLCPSNARLVRGKLAVFAAGAGAVRAFAVAADGVAVAREGSLELWTHAGGLRWAVPGDWVAVAIVTGHVIALDAEGALVFSAMRDGAGVGVLRLASPVPVQAWRLASIDAGRVVLALGEWLVWVDVAAKKTVRRVRAKEAVTALAADSGWVVAGTDGGSVCAFVADSGEPGAVLEGQEGGVTALALGKKTLFSGGLRPAVRAWPRSELGAAKRAAAPITALASRGALIAIGDVTGHVRVLSGDAELATRAIGDALIAMHLAHGEVLVAATSRVAMRSARPWDAPRPVAFRAPASAVAADEDYAFVGTASGAVDVYDLGVASHVTSYSLSDADISAIARLPGRLLVVGTGGFDGRVFVVDVADAKVLHRVQPHDDAFGVTCLASDPRGRLVASGADDGSIALIDPRVGKTLARIRLRETPTSLAFDGAGRRLACVFADGAAALVNLGPGRAKVEDFALSGAARVAWGDHAVIGFSDGRVERLADTSSPKPASIATA